MESEILRKEIDELRRETSRLEILRKRLAAMEELLATFEEEGAEAQVGNLRQGSDAGQQRPAPSPPEFTGVRATTAARLRAAWTAIIERDAPIRTDELVKILEEQSIEIGGQDSVATLSATLSHSPHFKTLGRNRGWTVCDVEGEPPGHMWTAPCLQG